MTGILACLTWTSGCHVSGSSGEVSPTQIPASGNDKDSHSLPVDSILETHTAALHAFESFNEDESGLKPVFKPCIDVQTPVDQAWIKAMSRRTDGAWLLFALRLSQANAQYLSKAISIIDMIRSHEHDYEIEDILDFHQGRMWLAHAQIQDNEDPQSDYEHAYQLFSNVLKNRKSPYYHHARAEILKVSHFLNKDVSKELEEFIRTYPDYPGLLDFKLALATLQFNAGKTDTAVQTVQDLAYLYPWSPIAPKARQWLEERSQSDRARSFEENFNRVDKLRRARFWDEAEDAAVQAMPEYPESYQLMVQHARIAYERSYHEESAHRFETILEKLDGQVKDKLRPAGVIAYIYRAYAYAGNCPKALEYHAINAAKLGKKDRARATMEFALSCGALDVAWENAKTVYADATDGKDLYQYGLIAYLNGEYETARLRFAQAAEDLSGTYKRRVNYFIAQSTLKSAQKQASSPNSGNSETASAAVRNDESPKKAESKKSTSKKSSAKSKKSSKKSSKKKGPKAIQLAPATVERAKSQFEALIAADSSDYYAILAHSRLAELGREPGQSAPQTPAIQTFGEITQNPEPLRPWSMGFTYDEKAPLSEFDTQVEQLKTVIPELSRVKFLHEAELYHERNALFRTVAIEAMGITKMSKRPTTANLWTTKLSIDGHLVDNRKTDTGVWGCELNDYYFDLPPKKDTKSRAPIAERQAAIYDNAAQIRSFITNTLPAFHDYYMARKYTPAPKQTCGNEQNLKACSTLYPHAFSQAVIQAAQSNHITPDVIWALMNIESAFNPDSISHADAYGLLQIIPMTGYKIANAMNLSGFGPYDLIEPANSIRMGSWYFAQILHKFHGNTSLSMAAYNGGPHQVARWLTAYAKQIEQDAFIELIPYDEARNYVKKGMARLLIFHRIDEHNPNAFFEIPNELPQNFEEMPNY